MCPSGCCRSKHFRSLGHSCIHWVAMEPTCRLTGLYLASSGYLTKKREHRIGNKSRKHLYSNERVWERIWVSRDPRGDTERKKLRLSFSAKCPFWMDPPGTDFSDVFFSSYTDCWTMKNKFLVFESSSTYDTLLYSKETKYCDMKLMGIKTSSIFKTFLKYSQGLDIFDLLYLT